MMARFWSVVLLAVFSFSASAGTISSNDLEVNLDTGFPGIESYSFKGETVDLGGSTANTVLLNKETFKPAVEFGVTGDDSAEYVMDFADIGVKLIMEVETSPEAISFTITDIIETSDFMVKRIEMPGLVLARGEGDSTAALANFPKASYASEKPEDRDVFGKVSQLSADQLRSSAPDGGKGTSYAFVSDGDVCAGIYTNVMEEDLRMIVNFAGEGENKTISVAPGEWQWRQVSFMTTVPPKVKLIVATDNNDDGEVTWQDGAIAYRRNTPKAYGAGTLKDHVIGHIAMNFGSQATNPFLRVLDNAKKVWLYTDGMGQHIQFKGYQSEGHDSSHPDYGGNVGRRQGGRDDLNFVMRRGHDFDVLSGVHINATEYHREAKNFNWDIANEGSIGWSWLDESYHTDYIYDSAFGTLYPRLEEMRADLPWLDFVYLDVFYGRGWPGWRMHTKTNDLGILQFTEFPGVMERAVIWDHVANDWTQAIWGKGDRSEIARFIYYSEKDTFRHDPLLRGTNCDGFMGWHAERDMLQTIKSAFTVNLPTKYLQHFELIKQTDDSALFDSGAKTEVEGEVSKIYGADGQFIGSCRYEKPKSRPVDNLVFIPWDPMTEEKIYHWNDKGGESDWTVPQSWSDVDSAYLYRLTDLGRVFEKEVPVISNNVKLTGIKAGTPYVLYRDIAGPLPQMEWGEGGLVADPGFDSHSFDYWEKAEDSADVKFQNNKFGQTELIMSSKGGKISQDIHGLEAGETYAASVWFSVKGEQPATIMVKDYEPTLELPAINKEMWTVSTSSGSGKAAIDGSVGSIWHTAYGKTTPKHPHHITIDFGKTLMLDGFVQTARTDMHNGVITDYSVQASTNGEDWNTVIEKDTFEYDGNEAKVMFDEPVKAKYFKLIALSEHRGGPWASVAELDVIGEPATATKDGGKPKIATVTRTIDSTDLTNFTDQSSKYMSNWHRMKVLFDVPEGVDSAEIVISAAEGKSDSAVFFDDVRVVKSGRSTPPEDAENVVLYEDFENVDEGWGPFMYGWKGPMNTHLSETNLPYTNDTIEGEFSLKTRHERHEGIIYRTVPATLKLQSNTEYRVSFDYLSDTTDRYTFIAASGSDDDGMVEQDLTNGAWEPTAESFVFETGTGSDWYIGVRKNSRENGILVIDNVLVEKVE
ncbi:Endo-alpha-N-acetylgalactosaminidase precursor [Anaerohalosphaera lusitana]|uniref:Endo-alpha-N-acetylgalactosaminidase n=1 Tax=Anaerohalosphaera lusitana TaxID=1936003 RepID=A0A1U9NM98_9BACT|nr:endo-alpha-N-acetylgalactosaminidase family protein [Anaerohalosphaera lusitana]AQT69033.1 Endo-alpha-N-acetylgalactosaminidase precursor [Anaerohalosphaera lusitana]